MECGRLRSKILFKKNIKNPLQFIVIKMANKNSLSDSKDLDKKFGVIGVLLFLLEGTLGLILYFIFNDVSYLGAGVTLLIAGLIFFYVIQRKPQLKLMPDKMPLAIFISIYFIFIGMVFYFMSDFSSKINTLMSMYFISLPITLAGWFTTWTILLKIKKNERNHS